MSPPRTPRVLCVDDSDAILALERAILSPHHVVDAARDGREALERARAALPDCVLLDLSMAGMDGREVLRAMRADPVLRHVPVVVVTSEVRREAECLAEGATGFLAKPVRADALLAAVGDALRRGREESRRRGLAVLELGVGAVRLGVPLSAVRTVLLHPATRPLQGGPPHVTRTFDLHGRAVPVLDVAAALGVAPAVPLVERRLVVLTAAGDGAGLALRVDRVDDPREVGEAEVVPPAAGGPPGLWVRGPGGEVPVLDAADLSPEALPAALARRREQVPAPAS